MMIPLICAALTFHVGILASADSVPVAPTEAYTNRVMPDGPSPAQSVDAVNLHGADIELRLAATTLQGLANRDTGCVYLLFHDLEQGQGRFWLDELKRKGYIEDYRIRSEEEYFAEYLPLAKSLVVYDPDVIDTINVASMIASLENGMVVAPGLLERFATTQKVIDLRGRWQDGVEAYEWAFAELWPRMNHDVLAVLHPTHAHHHLRDFLVRSRVFTFYVHSPQAGMDLHERGKAFLDTLLRTAGPNTPIAGWWDGGHIDEGLTEYGGVGLAGEYGILTFGCNWQENSSLMSGIPVSLPALAQRFKEREIAPSPAFDPDKVYISYVIVESGDSPAYWPHVQLHVWRDEKRGVLPIGWSISPVLFEMLPSVAEWFIDNATPNDHFFMAVAGPLYVHPYRSFMTRTPDPESAWKGYLELTSTYMKEWGLNDVCLYTDAWREFDRAKQDPVTRRFTQGVPGLRTLILGMGRDEKITETSPHYVMDDVFVSHVFTRWDPHTIGRSDENNQWLAEEIRKHTPAQRPAFMFVHPLSWSYHPSDLHNVVERLGDEYVAVSPSALRELWMQSHEEKE